jgi:hypothetical protein
MGQGNRHTCGGANEGAGCGDSPSSASHPTSPAQRQPSPGQPQPNPQLNPQPSPRFNPTMQTVQFLGRLLWCQMSTTVCPADSEEAVSTSTRSSSTCSSGRRWRRRRQQWGWQWGCQRRQRAAVGSAF